MPLIYITGPTGAGKSTICSALRDKGFEALDTDDNGMRKMQNVNGKELLTLDLAVMRELHAKANDRLVFVCGTSATDLDAQNLFAKIILLTIDEEEQKKRILVRTNNEYGKEPRKLANALKWRNIQIQKYQNAGAEVIDATQPISKITEKILSIARSVLSQ